MTTRMTVNRMLALVLGVFLALSALSVIGGCTITGGAPSVPTARSIDELLTLHQSLIKLGVEASVITGLKTVPDREPIIKTAGIAFEHVVLSAQVGSLRNVLAKSVDLSTFTPTQKLFVDALTDEFAAQLEASRKAYCLDHKAEALCTTESAWLVKIEPYVHTFGSWLTEGVTLYHQETGR